MNTTQRIERKEAFVERVLNRVLSKREEEDAQKMAMLWERLKDVEARLDGKRERR